MEDFKQEEDSQRETRSPSMPSSYNLNQRKRKREVKDQLSKAVESLVNDSKGAMHQFTSICDQKDENDLFLSRVPKELRSYQLDKGHGSPAKL